MECIVRHNEIVGSVFNGAETTSGDRYRAAVQFWLVNACAAIKCRNVIASRRPESCDFSRGVRGGDRRSNI